MWKIKILLRWILALSSVLTPVMVFMLLQTLGAWLVGNSWCTTWHDAEHTMCYSWSAAYKAYCIIALFASIPTVLVPIFTIGWVCCPKGEIHSWIQNYLDEHRPKVQDVNTLPPRGNWQENTVN